MSELLTPVASIAWTTELVVALSWASAPWALDPLTLTWALKSSESGFPDAWPAPCTVSLGVEPPHAGAVGAAEVASLAAATVSAAAARITAPAIAMWPHRRRRGGA